MRSVWVLNWREELEDQSNQTEHVWPEVFWHKRDAIAFAEKLLSRITWEWECPADADELHGLYLQLNAGVSSATFLYQLTDSDNLVFELTKKRIREK